jgi:hypothetical protein
MFLSSRMESGVRPSFLGFYRLMNAVRDDAGGGAVQPHEVSHLFEPILVDASCPVENQYVGILFISRRSSSKTLSRPISATCLSCSALVINPLGDEC